MWKNLKGYFVVEEEGQLKPKSSTLPDKRTGAPAKPKPESTDPHAPAAPPGGRVKEQFVDVLLKAMEKANLPGFDYLEYKKALQNLEKMNLDDASRFQAAYAAAQSMGVTPQQLTDSANHYLQALSVEQEKFAKAVSGQREDQVIKREAQLKQFDESVGQQEAKIKELQDQIAKTRERQTQLRKSIGESRAKIDATAADFDTTYHTITGSIGEDIAKMREYLK